ncbi:MAG TPA: GntR family transcriptional regulator [Solirubrobacterales bacterium]|jgi:DNA-binding GntR family transcriptional regulator|nr:GntR family transcriptional regulator [Solirubrobacterales bacterium]
MATADSAEAGEFQVQSVADQVYEVLRARIAGGEIERGSRLHQEDLAKEFGVSRTPVREALRRLAAEGLVDLFANRGARVADATDEQLRSSYETRLVVEPGAARMAADRSLSGPMKAMRSAIADEERAGRSPAKHFRANRSFHLALVEATGNPQLVQFMEHVWIGRIGATLYEDRLDPTGLSADKDAHRSIADAIEAGDGARAEDLTRGHLERAMELLFRD